MVLSNTTVSYIRLLSKLSMEKINVRKRLNDVVRRIPHVGNVLTSEISAKRFAATTAIAAHLVLGNISPSRAATGFVETMVGNEATTLDTKIVGTLSQRIGFVARNRLSIENRGVNPFAFIDLSYNIKGGLGAVLETQVTPGIGIDPRPGAQFLKRYERRNNKWIVFALLSRSVKEQPNSKLPNSEFDTLIQYNRALNKKLEIMMQLETATNWCRWDALNFSAERIRLGIHRDAWIVGVGGDFTHLGNSSQVKQNWGGFVSMNF